MVLIVTNRWLFPLIFIVSTIVGAAEKPLLWQQPEDLGGARLDVRAWRERGRAWLLLLYSRPRISDGTNPKFDVRDAHGTKWKVKLGEEPRPETAASRFVWAVGYSTYDYYFLPSISVAGLPAKLKRGNNLRLSGDSFANVRLKRAPKGEKKEGVWRWKDNPFSGTRELNGLRVLMALVNNWGP